MCNQIQNCYLYEISRYLNILLNDTTAVSEFCTELENFQLVIHDIVLDIHVDIFNYYR